MMIWRVGISLFAALAMAFAASAAEQSEIKWLSLGDGVNARFLTAMDNPNSAEREIVVNFMLSDTAVIADHTKVIEIADRLFGIVVLKPADTKGYKRAVVNLLVSEKTSGDTTLQTFEGFHYARRDDAVWLRQAGPEAWKTAQDPAAWSPPESKEIRLSGSTVYVDYIIEIQAPEGLTRALGVELHSATPVLDVQAKYAEMKELWGRMDREKLKQDGFDLVRMENFAEPARGRFHVRQMVFLNIPRPAGGDWPTLPDQMPGAPIIAGLPSAMDEATRLAVAAVASIAPPSPIAQVAAPREAVAASGGVKLDAVNPKAKGDVAVYLAK